MIQNFFTFAANDRGVFKNNQIEINMPKNDSEEPPQRFDLEADKEGRIAGNEFDGVNGKASAKNKGVIENNKVRRSPTPTTKVVLVSALSALAAIAAAVGAYFKFRAS